MVTGSPRMADPGIIVNPEIQKRMFALASRSVAPLPLAGRGRGWGYE